MAVGILIITHEQIGESFEHLACGVMHQCPLKVETLPASRNCDPDKVLAEGKKKIKELDDGDGVLIMTDLFGSTPSNISSTLMKEGHVQVVAGLNLPMLMRVMNYPKLDLDAMRVCAVEGGRAGIIDVTEYQ